MTLWPARDLGTYCVWKHHGGALQAAPCSGKQPKHRCSIKSESLSSNTDRHEISPSLACEVLLCTSRKLRLKVRCLLARFPPRPPRNPYVKLDCAAGASRVPWDNLKLIILSEGGSPWKKNDVSEAAAVLRRVLRFCMQSRIIPEGFRCVWHQLEQVEKMPLNFIIHFSGLVSP